jgi:hypothetical protein
VCITYVAIASSLSTCAKPVDRTQDATFATLTQMKSMSAMSSDTPNSPRKLKWIWWYVLPSSLVIASINNAYAINNNDIEKEKYKLYSHIKLLKVSPRSPRYRFKQARVSANQPKARQDEYQS